MNDPEYQEVLYKMLNGDMNDLRMPDQQRQVPQTRNGQIEAHMKLWRESEGMTEGQVMKNTSDSVRKQPSASVPDVSTLRPISISELELARNPCRGRVLFCTIITPPVLMASAMTIVDDANGDIANLAVYNITNAKKKLCVGRKIGIIEPFYKIRADGTAAIRVDNPGEIRYGVEPPLTQSETNVAGVEQEMTGVNVDITTIIPDRRPEMHRIVIDQDALHYRDEGNAAFKAQIFNEAERLYTSALKAGKKSLVKPSIETQQGIALWTLYSNRSMARLKLGKAGLALKDAIMSHTCAPSDVVKPFCALHAGTGCSWLSS